MYFRYMFICLLIVGWFLVQEFYFLFVFGIWEMISLEVLDWCEEEFNDFQEFFGECDIKVFIVLKEGCIVLEWYYDFFMQDSFWYWVFVGKLLMGMFIGIVQEEGLFFIDDFMSDYLGVGWMSMLLEQEV